MPRDRKSLVMASSYELTIEGIEAGPFSTIGGMSIQLGVASNTTTGATGEHQTDLVPGEVNWPTLYLSRPFQADDLAMFDWFQETIAGTDAERSVKTGSLVAYDSAKTPLITLNFDSAFIQAWSLSTFDAQSSAPIEETIMLVVHRIVKA